MDSRELRSLQEAYMEVVENQQLDETGEVSFSQEEVDFYDIILSHLLDEGYAETPEAAEAIMANMSEDWRDGIIDEGFKRMNRVKIERQANRLGGDRGETLRGLAKRLNTPQERKFSTSQARKNRTGSGEYRQRQHLQARDDAQADIKKYGLH